MAALFLLALALITWQALRTETVLQPAFEIATKTGERLAPGAVPSWRTPLNPPRNPERLAFLTGRSLIWPGVEAPPDCKVFVRFSSLHWVQRPASRSQVQSWSGSEPRSAQLLYLPAASFLDDDDQDGDRLDSGELREAGPGAEVEIFCGGTL
ncbi:MAG TPA: hypothetical protein VMW27_03950 [Thermoanaerobaculia bacterium]|nr:hypothetical protein [Thermoanaerobaculia bacterium]